jgi:hypothetical protein
MQPTVNLLVGPSCTGKSLSVRFAHRSLGCFYPDIRRDGTLCFDGYMGERVIILDDICSFMTKLDLCRIINNHENVLTWFSTKNGLVVPRADRLVWLISNVYPSKWQAFKDGPEEELQHFFRHVSSWTLWNAEEQQYDYYKLDYDQEWCK